MSLSRHSGHPFLIRCLGMHISASVLATSLVIGAAHEGVAADQIADADIAAIDQELKEALAGRSEARQRMAVRRVLRSGQELLASHTSAPNRYELLGSLYKAQQKMLDLDASKENREALLAICRQLAEAPNDYAELRFNADLLLSQTEQARKGATPSERVGALQSFIERYRGTSVEKKMLKVITMMTLELGNDALLYDLRQAISERFWHDIDMINFKRDQLGGQVMAAPFQARLKDSDGVEYVFPQDRLSRSTLFFVWSKDTEDLDERIAKWNTLTGRKEGPQGEDHTHVLKPELFDVMSLNLDGLPDAGASILREKGVNWTALHLPGGRNNPIYKTYMRWDPMGLHVSPTGCAALLLPGSHPKDYPRRVYSYMQKNDYYLRQLTSFFSGAFLVSDAVSDFDPSIPPELKAAQSGNAKTDALARTESSVPTNILHDIQACFPSSPNSYERTHGETRAHFKKAATLSRDAIEKYPDAPDIWLVHNRLIVALLGQWRSTGHPSHLFMAGKAANVALNAEYPEAAKVVPLMCLARTELRQVDNNPADVLAAFVAACGGETVSAPAVAAASYMALDVGNRALHTHYRRVLLDQHADNPSMWPVTSAALDRFHRYQKYFHPYHRGWSFGRRAARYYKTGEPQDAERDFSGTFTTYNGESMVFPTEDAADYNVFLFQAPPTDEQKQSRRYKPMGDLKSLNTVATNRPDGNVKVWTVFLDEEAKSALPELDVDLKKHILFISDEHRNPIVQRLGVYQGLTGRNMAIIRGDGRIVNTVSSLAWQGTKPANILSSTMEWMDETSVDNALAKGDTEAAYKIALRNAPHVEPDPRYKRRYRGPSPVYLRCRAKVYIAMEDWRKALADVKTLVDRQRLADAGMSVESPDLLEALRLQSIVYDRLGLNAQGERRP